MATYDYTGLRATAERLITKYGRDITLKRDTTATGGTAHDPNITTATYAAEGVLMDYKDKERDGTLITTRDKKLYISTKDLSVVPLVSDRVTVVGIDHQIMDVKTLDPGGTTLVYMAQVRR